MTKSVRPDITLEGIFSKKKPVQTFEELKVKSKLQPRTLQRRIKEGGILASYNQNGKFYTATIYCHFNPDGIWKYNEILFSKVGNLYATIIWLIDHSTGGFTGKELSEIIMVKADDALRNLWLQGRVRRDKLASNYVYFSVTADLFNKQQKERSKQYNDAPTVVFPSLPNFERIIAVLLAIIKQNSVDPNSIQEFIAEQGMDFSLEEITTIIGHYQIKKKKRR